MKTNAQLAEIRELNKDAIALRHGIPTDLNSKEKHILCCGGTGCTSSHSKDIIAEFEKQVADKKLNNVKIVMTGCFGLCALGPVVIVYPEGTFYSCVKVEDVARIVDEHIIGGNPVKELVYEETLDGDEIKPLDKTPFYEKQTRIALRNCGVIDPENIDEYIAADGYLALKKALTEMLKWLLYLL